MNTTLEAQLRDLADEAERQLDDSDAEGPADLGPPPRRSRRFALAAAATVLLAAGGGGLLWLSRDSGSDDGRAPVTDEMTDTALPPTRAPRPIPENTPTLAVPDDEIWFAFGELPEGFRFVRAVDYTSVVGTDGPTWRSVDYESVDGTTTVTVTREGPPMGLDQVTEPIGIGDETWTIGPLSDTGRDFVAVRGEATRPENSWPYYEVGVAASGITRDAFVSLLDDVDEVQASDLRRPPLPSNAPDGDIVARATQDGRDVVLRAVTDGRSFVMSYGTNGSGGGGGAVRLGSEWIVVDGAAGPLPGFVADGDAESLIYGLAHPDVAEVAVELTDGALVRSAPQDEYGFEENFFLIAFPTSTEMGLERLAAVIALDADGTELQRDTSLAE